jgi:hypothetical protein
VFLALSIEVALSLAPLSALLGIVVVGSIVAASKDVSPEGTPLPDTRNTISVPFECSLLSVNTVFS